MKPLIEETLRIAAGEAGIRETTSNWGPRVRQYLASCGIRTPAPWCAALVFWATQTAAGKLGIENPFLRSAYCPHLANWGREEDILEDSPAPGDVFLRYATTRGVYRACHTGFVVGLERGRFLTVEGNAQPLTARVLTPDGWRLMGDLETGDALIDPDGGTGYVLGVFDKGRRRVYRVLFSDGSSAEACSEHLWRVSTDAFPGREVVLTTARIADKLAISKHIRTPTMQPAQLTSQALPLDPYLLGVLLGDGGFTMGLRPKAGITSVEPEIIEAAGLSLPAGCELKPAAMSTRNEYRIVGSTRYGYREPNLVMDRLVEMGLSGRRSYEKFIPSAYLWTDLDSRVRLLQGLLDTDGTIDPLGRIEFCSTSRQLAEDVQQLIQGLGGRVSINMKRNVYYTAPQQPIRTRARDAYRLQNIRLPDQIKPFHLTRKAARVVTGRRQRGWNIVDVMYVRDDEVRCIATSCARNLYVTDGFNVTHNTNPGGGREGYGVFRRSRGPGAYKFLRWERLIPEAATWEVYLGERKLCDAPFLAGRVMVPCRLWGRALGFAVGWDNEANTVSFDGHTLPEECVLIEGEAYAWVRSLVAFSGLRLRVDQQRRAVYVSR